MQTGTAIVTRAACSLGREIALTLVSAGKAVAAAEHALGAATALVNNAGVYPDKMLL